MSNYIRFNTKKNKIKPNTLNNQDISCPFCNYDEVKERQGYLMEFEHSLLVENLFPTIEGGFQTVFIETKDCDATLLTYDKETLFSVLKSYFESFTFLKEQYNFPYIAAFKNFGPHSSGSIKHQHMQLIGFHNIIDDDIKDIHFQGIPVYKDDDLEINFSDRPLNEYYEINFSIDKETLFSFGEAFETFSLELQKVLNFVLNKICSTNSFNLIFYLENDTVRLKILPRVFGSSANYSTIFVGYRIKSVPKNLPMIASELKDFLQQKK